MADETINDCLKGYVGVAPICIKGNAPEAENLPADSTPGSGLYVTDLPGITLESIESLADADQKNFRGVWNEVEKRALLKFRTAALAEVNKCFRISDITIVDCLVCANKELFATALWYLLGSELCYERLYSSAISRFTTINKKDAEILRNDFLADFQVELKNAMRGVDIDDNDCIDCEPQSNGDIKYRESTP